MSELKVQDIATLFGSKDGGASLDSPYGFVLRPNGDIWHLKLPCTHGVVVALLEHDAAIQHGIGIPDEEYSTYEYQSFLFDKSAELGYITVGLGFIDRASYRHNQNVTQEQINALKKYFFDLDLMDNEFQTDYGSCSGRVVISNLDYIHSNKKLAGSENKDYTLIEPNE